MAAGDWLRHRTCPGRHGHLLVAILFGVTGLLFVTRPMIGAEVATVVMAMFFMIGGLFQLIGSLAVAPIC
jgi:uncharacterized membrane protein HdeD (DUF308 family)